MLANIIGTKGMQGLASDVTQKPILAILSCLGPDEVVCFSQGNGILLKRVISL